VTDNINNLLSQIKAILEKHSGESKRQQLAFNVFSILRRESEEVGLHSAFLFALLDPNGGHQHKAFFLNALMDSLGLNQFSESKFDISKKEFSADDGRVDLYFKQGDRALIIENKIYASDQPHQLEKYIQTAKDGGAKNIDVVYLTLDGGEPSQDSLGEYEHLLKEGRDKNGVKLLLASYGSDIVGWLKRCIAEIAAYPTTRETLVLYKRLVLQITGQSLLEEESMDIIKCCLSDQNTLRAALKLIENGNKLKERIISKALDNLRCKLSKCKSVDENSIKIPDVNKPKFKPQHQFIAYEPGEWNGYRFVMQAYQGDGKLVHYSILLPKRERHKDGRNTDLDNQVIHDLSLNHQVYKLTDEDRKWRCWHERLEQPFNDLASREALIGLQSEEEIEKIAKRMCEIIEQINKNMRTPAT